MQGIDVRLTWDEIFLAATIGVCRQLHALKQGLQEAHGRTKRKKGPFQCHIDGALGELVVAKSLNLYWNGTVGSVSSRDVGSYEVRTRDRHDRDMILHEDDDDGRKFICVTGGPRDYKVWGWCYAYEGKQAVYFDKVIMAAPVYIVPKLILRPIETINES